MLRPDRVMSQLLAIFIVISHVLMFGKFYFQSCRRHYRLEMVDLDQRRRFAIFILTSGSTNYQRIPQLMNMWGYRMMNYSRVSDFKFLTIDVPGFEQFSSLSVPQSYRKLYKNLTKRPKRYYNFDLAIKDAWALLDCVKNTTAAWCFRLMDDTYVNPEGFKMFVENLDTLGDPWEKEIILGNCLARNRRKWFLQGGSGIVFSRRAAERFIEFHEEWITSLNIHEDGHITRIAERFGITSQSADSPFFAGHFLDPGVWQNFSWNSPTDFPICPEVVGTERHCNHHLIPYHNVAFLHCIPAFMNQEAWQTWFKNVPRDAMMYFTGKTFQLCRARINNTNTSGI